MPLPEETTCSGASVRYATGEVAYSATDLSIDGYGVPWGHTRSFSSRLSVSDNLGNGYNWMVQEWPYLFFRADGGIAALGTAIRSLWFDKSGSSYIAKFNARERLVYDAAALRYRLWFPDGAYNEYDNVTGMFRKRVAAGGSTIEVKAMAPNGKNFTEVERTYTSGGTTVTEQFLYEYSNASGDYQLMTLTLRRRVGAGTWQDVNRVNYTYYGYQETYGNEEDLKTVTTQVWDGADWQNSGTSYYRYHLDRPLPGSSSSSSSSSSSEPPAHLLKFVLEPAAYERLSNDPGVTDPLTAPDAIVALYADYYFEYDNQRRVNQEVIKSGSQIFLFDYAESAFPDGYNSWKTKTVETLPDGNLKSTYCNFAGQAMLIVYESDGDQWLRYFRYDNRGNVILQAAPSALTGYDEEAADLVSDSGSGTTYLRDHAGLIKTWDFDTASCYVSRESIQEGELGTPTKLVEYEYVSCGCIETSSSSSSSSSSGGGGCGCGFWFLAKETVYPSDTNQDLTQITSHSYSFYTGTCAIKEHVTTLPVVSTEQNGSGIAATRREYRDSYGNATWSRDERGFITRMAYDIPTGAITQQVADVDTSLYEDAPAGWSTPSGGGLNLVTDFEHDDQGRIIQTLGPSHAIDHDGSETTVRTASWTVYDDVNHVTYSGQGYATGTAPDYEYTLIDPVSITKMDAGGRVNEQIQATAPSTSGTLAEIIEDAGGGEDAFPQSSYTRWTTMQYTDCCLAASQRVYHTIPASGEGTSGTNYDETDFGYNVMKRRNRTVTPGGTITDLVYEARGMVIGTYVGTNDDGATETDPTGGGLDPDNDMVLVTENEYDDGTDGGDGNLTEMIQHVDDTTTRVTDMTYDFRNRRVTTDGEVDYFEKSYYDNLDRVVMSERYDTSEEGNLIARNETLFDDRGRVYQSIRYAVDPDTGDVGNSLTDNTWFDDASNVIKSLPSGSQLFTKTEYDSLNRPQTRYTGYDLDETGYPG